MAFSTMNSIHVIRGSSIRINPPTNVYVNNADSASLTYKFTQPSGAIPSYYEANITADGVSYTVNSNTISPLIITGLTADTSYNGFIYSVFNGKYSTKVAIKGYVMPTNCNITASAITNINFPSTYINNFKQGMVTSDLTLTAQNGYTKYSSNCLLYMNATNWTATIPNLNKNMIINQPTTFYIKHSYIAFTANSGLNLFLLYAGLQNFTYSNNFRVNVCGTGMEVNINSLNVLYWNETDATWDYNQGIIRNCTESHDYNTSYFKSDSCYHQFLIFDGSGNIKNYIYTVTTSNVLYLIYYFNLTKNYVPATLSSKIGTNNLIGKLGYSNTYTTYIANTCNIYDFKVFDKALTVSEMSNITRNN